MSDWKRITKEVSLEELRPEMGVEINKYIKLYNLGPILSDVMMCIQTESERTKMDCLAVLSLYIPAQS